MKRETIILAIIVGAIIAGTLYVTDSLNRLKVWRDLDKVLTLRAKIIQNNLINFKIDTIHSKVQSKDPKTGNLFDVTINGHITNLYDDTLTLLRTDCDVNYFFTIINNEMVVKESDEHKLSCGNSRMTVYHLAPNETFSFTIKFHDHMPNKSFFDFAYPLILLPKDIKKERFRTYVKEYKHKLGLDIALWGKIIID